MTTNDKDTNGGRTVTRKPYKIIGATGKSRLGAGGAALVTVESDRSEEVNGSGSSSPMGRQQRHRLKEAES